MSITGLALQCSSYNDLNTKGNHVNNTLHHVHVELQFTCYSTYIIIIPAVFFGDFLVDRNLSRSSFFTLRTLLTTPPSSRRATKALIGCRYLICCPIIIYTHDDTWWANTVPLTLGTCTSSSVSSLGLLRPSPRRAFWSRRPPPFSPSWGLCVGKGCELHDIVMNVYMLVFALHYIQVQCSN